MGQIINNCLVPFQRKIIVEYNKVKIWGTNIRLAGVYDTFINCYNMTVNLSPEETGVPRYNHYNSLTN